ncbi:hypothetical protein Tco_0192833, partial [Tanacetum coccineum]
MRIQSMEDINKSEGKLINGLPGVQLTEEEEKVVDNVGWKPFLDYVVISEGLWFSVFCVLSQASFVARQAAASYWLAFGIQIPNVTTVTLISVHTLLSVLSAIFVFLRSFLATLFSLPFQFSMLQWSFMTLLPLDEFLQGRLGLPRKDTVPGFE